MGCDIHVYTEKKDDKGTWKSIPKLSVFQDRNYNVFNFFAGVRKYDDIEPIALPRGIPKDVSSTARSSFKRWGMDAHTPSWLSLEELMAFNYDKKVYGDSSPRQGTYRDFLEEDFFNDLEKMKEKGVERIVFWFDN